MHAPFSGFNAVSVLSSLPCWLFDLCQSWDDGGKVTWDGRTGLICGHTKDASVSASFSKQGKTTFSSCTQLAPMVITRRITTKPPGHSRDVELVLTLNFRRNYDVGR